MTALGDWLSWVRYRAAVAWHGGAGQRWEFRQWRRDRNRARLYQRGANRWE